MTKFGLILACIFLLAPISKANETSSAFGRYIGTLSHDDNQEEQFAKLDFIQERSDGSTLNLKAVLTLHFGDFTSQEYTSFHFDSVTFNLLNQTLVFDQPDQDIRLIVDQFNGSELKGELKSAVFGTVGQLRLKLDLGQKVQNTLPLIEPVQGEYQGKCDDKNVFLRLFSYRSTDDTTKIGNPFGAYEVIGHIAQYNSKLCGQYYDKPCVIQEFDTASYNYFFQDLKLSGPLGSLSCKKVGAAIDCGSCKFERISKENLLTQKRPPTSTPTLFLENELSDTQPTATNISGEYEGYVHHEYLDTYQKARIDLSTFQSVEGGESNLKISAVAQLVFGERKNGETLTYRFDNVNYPNPFQPFQIVFARPEADVDAVIRVTSIQNGVIKGEWYSLMFGKVGRFEMRKKEATQIPEPTSLMSGVTGEYKNKMWLMHLAVGLGRTPINTDNPFFPLQLNGYVWHVKNYSPKDDIQSGSYDFYTGKFAIRFDNEYLLTGNRTKDGQFSLSRVANKFGVLAQDFDPTQYQKTK